MRMHRLALNLAATAMGVGLLVAAAPSAQATSGGCFFPTLAVSEYADIFPSLSLDEKICKKQCSQFKSGCNSVASGSDKCLKGGGNGVFGALKQDCKEIEDKETRNECQNAVKDDQKSFKDFLKEQKSDAKMFCKDESSSCKDICTGVL